MLFLSGFCGGSIFRIRILSVGTSAVIRGLRRYSGKSGGNSASASRSRNADRSTLVRVPKRVSRQSDGRRSRRNSEVSTRPPTERVATRPPSTLRSST